VIWPSSLASRSLVAGLAAVVVVLGVSLILGVTGCVIGMLLSDRETGGDRFVSWARTELDTAHRKSSQSFSGFVAQMTRDRHVWAGPG
jgi:hypothetical protein